MRRAFCMSSLLVSVVLFAVIARPGHSISYQFRTEGADVEFLSNTDHDNISKAISADLNGDGIQDIVVGGDADYGHGIAKWNVIFGRQNWSAPRTIDFATTRCALYIESLAYKEFAWNGYQTYLTKGDFNGDGKEDVAFGGFSRSTVYVLYGRAEYTPKVKNFTVADFDVTYIGAGRMGWVVSMGDINGDGLSDLATLAPDSHTVYCFFGKSNLAAGTRVNVTDATADLVFTGSNVSGQVLALGDYNGDGRADIALGNRSQTLIYTSTDTLIAQHVINTETVVPTVTITGRTTSIARAGDINQDGRDDFVGLTAGNAYVVFGTERLAGRVV